jgi:hypothetical protein
MLLNSYSSSEPSFASDDYFVLMDNNEGDPLTPFADIAVGRMIVFFQNNKLMKW